MYRCLGKCIRENKSRRTRSERNVQHIVEKSEAFKILFKEPEEKRQFRGRSLRWENSIVMDVKKEYLCEKEA
jgi:hypothetical protein